MGPSFNIVVVFVVVFFAQMFDLSQLLVRFYNRETLFAVDGTRTVLCFPCSLSTLSWKRERGGGVYSRGEGTQEECFCQERR